MLNKLTSLPVVLCEVPVDAWTVVSGPRKLVETLASKSLSHVTVTSREAVPIGARALRGHEASISDSGCSSSRHVASPLVQYPSNEMLNSSNRALPCQASCE